MRLVARLIPAVVFLGVVGLHFGWFAYFGPQTRWLPLDDDTSGLPIRAYLESQEPWLGLSYALSLGFGTLWLGRYRERRFSSARTLTVGGVTLSGALAVVGCYLLGCCGSPMLAVYFGLLGPSVLPLTGPAVLAFTASSLALAGWWMKRVAPPSAERACSSGPQAPCDCT